MTPDELRALGMARYGHDWQAPLARAIGVSPRHMRRLAAGQSAISEGVEADIKRALGGSAIVDPDWPRDTYIVGDARDDLGAVREYVVRCRPPRFTARVVSLDNAGEPEGGEQPVDVITGIVYASEGYVLAEIAWADAMPGIADIHRMLEEACDAIDASVD